jgi:hypothetical protein
MTVKSLMDQWLGFINPSSTNNFNYKVDYSADLLINQYSVANERIYSVKLIDAYPLSINQMDLDWSSDGYHKLTATFAYTYWERVY